MGKTNEKFSPRSFYNEERKKENISEITAIKHTQEFIKKHYQSKISVDELLKRYKDIDFDAKEYYPLLSTILAGFISGCLATLFIEVESATSKFGFVGVIVYLGVLIAIALGIRFAPKRFKGLKSDYSSFIASYELTIIINKLHDDYGFNCKP